MYERVYLFRDYDTQMLSGFLGVEFTQEDLLFLQKEQNRKIEKKEDMIVLSKSKSAVSMVIKNGKSGDLMVGVLGSTLVLSLLI